MSSAQVVRQALIPLGMFGASAYAYTRVPDEEQTMWNTWEPEILEKLIEATKQSMRINGQQAQPRLHTFDVD